MMHMTKISKEELGSLLEAGEVQEKLNLDGLSLLLLEDGRILVDVAARVCALIFPPATAT